MYRTHTCGQLRAANVNETVTLAGWVQKVRNLGAMTFIDLRDRYGITQIVVEEHSPADVKTVAGGLGREYVLQVEGRVVERSSKNPKMPTGDIEVVASKLVAAARGRSAPVHHRGELGRRRRPAYEIPLPRPAPSSPAAQHDPASQDGPGDPPLPERRRFPGDRNPLPGQFHARRRPGLRRAEPHEPQPILRPAPVAPDPQAAADGRRLRQILPDRALFPRRRPAGRPPARIHADRLRNVVRRAGGRARNLRALGQAHVPRSDGHRTYGAAAPHALDRSDGEIRLGQTRPALRYGVRRPDGPGPRSRLRGFRRRGVRHRLRRDGLRRLHPQTDRRPHGVRQTPADRCQGTRLDPRRSGRQRQVVRR